MTAPACDNRTFDAMLRDYRAIKAVMDAYRNAGGRMPAPLGVAISTLDQAFVTGRNVDAAMKSACLEMGNFLASNEEFCARFAGFDSKADLQRRGGERWQDVDNYDICMARHYYRQAQAEAVNKVLNLSDPRSFAAVFTRGTLRQFWEIVTKWSGERFRQAAPKPTPKPAR